MRTLVRWSLAICLISVGAAKTSVCANDNTDKRGTPTSLRDDSWTARYDWIYDFEYDRFEVTAQRQKCIVYTLDMKIRHVRQLRERNLPWIGPTASANDEWIVGMTSGWPSEPKVPPQPIFGYQITNPEVDGPKLRVVLAGGNHPSEHPACWTLHGLIEFLVSDDPRAQTLRDKAVFYVYPSVNPEGKLYLESPAHLKIMTGRSSPELVAAGERNHNRVWDQDGKFKTIDTVKESMLRDTGGRPDYLLDFHGIPRTSFAFVSNESPLSRALSSTKPGLNQRLISPTPRTLHAAALDSEWLGARYALTPEIANMSLENMFKQGQRMALAIHNLVTDNVPESLERSHPEITPVRPCAPKVGWLFEGDLQATFGNIPAGTGQQVEWSEDRRFDDSDNRSLRLNGKDAFVDFGQPPELALNRAMTVALWVKGEDRPEDSVYLFGRYLSSGDRRSWALAQRADSGEMLAIVSADGTHRGDRIKRVISSLWPVEQVFDGQWRHIACTFDGGANSRLRLFIDGTELEVGNLGHFFNDADVAELHLPDVPVTLGALPGGRKAFKGLIDEAAVWDVALSPAAIRWLSQNSIRKLGQSINSPAQ